MSVRRHELRRYPWQVRDSGQLLLVVAAGVWLVASVAQTAADGLQDPRIAIAFGALIAFGEVLRLNLPGDRESAPIGFAGALAYALLIRVGTHVVHYSAQQVVTVATIGMIIGALPHLAVGRPARVSGMAVRLLCVACVAYIFRPLAGNGAVDRHWGLAFSLMTSLAVLALLLEAVLTALLRVDEQRARFRVALVDEMRVQLPLGAAVGASALLIAFAAEVMGLAALAVFTAPLLVTQVAFRRYAGIRATYLQTVRALAKVTEIGGYVEAGHSERVATLAVADRPGARHPRAPAARARVRRAHARHRPAVAARPDSRRGHRAGLPPGPAAHRRARRRRDPAGAGARLGGRDRAQAERALPRRRRQRPMVHGVHGGRAQPSGPPLSSRIIKAANAFDDLVGSSLDPGRAAAAVQRLRLEMASEYDPSAVEALSRVVNRRSVML